jgi:uroporphyrin-3 C-methyltransferase
VKGVFSGMVTVSKMDEAERPLLAPDDVYFLRTNLSLQLQAARIALLRGEQSVFEQSLDDADAWIGEYFDVNSEQVASARATIAEIRNGMFAITPPDISRSLRLLRQYQTLAESAE